MGRDHLCIVPCKDFVTGNVATSVIPPEGKRTALLIKGITSVSSPCFMTGNTLP